MAAPKRLVVDAAAMLMQPFNLKFGPRVPESSYALSTTSADGARANGAAQAEEMRE